MNISGNAEIRSGSLYLDRKPLDIETHGVDHLRYVLTSLGRNAIVDHIEQIYHRTSLQNPGLEVPRPSINVMSLGRDQDTVLTQLGQHNRTSLHRSYVELHRPIQELGDIIHGYGFTPEVRSRLGARATSYSALFLRNPETDPEPATPLDALPAALGFVEPPELRNLRSELRQAYVSSGDEIIRAVWNRISDENQSAVDSQGNFYGHGARALASIGMAIGEANLRVDILGDDYLLDPERYEATLHDILLVLSNLEYEGDGTSSLEPLKPYKPEHLSDYENLSGIDAQLWQEIERVRSLRQQA